jgi:hypothetical protein
LGLLFVPSTLARLLFGAPFETPAPLTVARVAGAALICISIACWLARENGRALGVAMLIYNLLVIAVLAHAALWLRISGLGLWPVVALHLGFALWCVACLRTNHLGFRCVTSTETHKITK